MVKDIEVLEKVQHRATRMVPGLKRLPYEDRLRRLDIHSFTARRLRGDLIETYKLLHGYTNVDYRIFFQKHDDHPNCTDHNTRGHNWKLFKPQSKKGLQCRVHFFSQRVINYWNDLPSIAHLYSKTKQKVKFISDICNFNTLFLCFCETYLKEDILDSEIQIPDFSLIRCDRKARVGGGVCVYLRHSVGFDTCLSYSNSVCEVLVLRLHQPSLLLVLLYRPLSCSIVDFKDAIYQVELIISKLTLPLPNIILLGDFNFPGIDWSCPDVSCEAAAPLISLSNSLLLNQQIDKPTRLSNILDLIFCPDELIKSISVADTYLSDHRILTISTLIPMTPTKSNSILNPPQSTFEKLDFNKSDWPNLCVSLKSIDCSVIDSDKPIDVCIDELIDEIANKCSIHVPLKRPKKPHISKYHRERKILMRRRAKLCKKTIPCHKITQELIDIEAAICTSH